MKPHAANSATADSKEFVHELAVALAVMLAREDFEKEQEAEKDTS